MSQIIITTTDLINLAIIVLMFISVFAIQDWHFEKVHGRKIERW